MLFSQWIGDTPARAFKTASWWRATWYGSFPFQAYALPQRWIHGIVVRYHGHAIEHGYADRLLRRLKLIRAGLITS